MKTFHLLNDIETFGKDFPQKVPVLIKELSEVLEIDIDKLDKSTNSLKLIDIALYRKKNLINEGFIKVNIMRIEAYLGEVFIKNYGGNWQVEYDKKHNIYVPYVDFKGRKIDFYQDTLEHLSEWDFPEMEFCYVVSIPRELRG